MHSTKNWHVQYIKVELDPSQKDFTISGGTKSFESLKPEVDKYISLC